MKTPVLIALVLGGLMVARGQNFVANMDGAQDGGMGRQGTGLVNLTLSGNVLTLSGTYSGLTTASTLGHIHGPAAPGVGAGVLYDLVGPGIMSVGATSGTYSGSLTLTPTVGPYTTVAAQIADLDAGRWYLNIHDSTFPGGEIRGQIVPEPSAIALLGFGSVALVGCVRLGRRI